MKNTHTFFTWASALYDATFKEWLYIPFAVRTLILLLVVWILLYAAAQLFRYAVGPLLILFGYHVLFRAYNFLVLETLQEWIYIRYYSEDKTFLRSLYLKLCDQIKANRMKLDYTRYMGILRRGTVRRASHRLLVVSLVIGSLWVVSFGLFNEYAADRESGAVSAVGTDKPSETAEPPTLTPAAVPTEADAKPEPATFEQPADGGFPDPALWNPDAEIMLKLNAYGVDGSNIRDLPGTRGSEVLEVVWGDVSLEYLGDFSLDYNNGELYWLKVRTPAGVEGYISSSLLEGPE